MQKHFHTTAEAFNLQQQETSTCNSRSHQHATAEFRHKPEPRKSHATKAAAMQT
jgi:hypothetical protein